MADNFEYISHASLIYRNNYRHPYLGEVAVPIVYGVQGKLREYYGVKERPPIASTLYHIIAAVGGWMYGTLVGALSGRKIPSWVNHEHIRQCRIVKEGHLYSVVFTV